MKRYFLVVILLAAVGVGFWWSQRRLTINTDITAALPQADPVVSSARRIAGHHPALENVFIDFSLAGQANRDTLAQAADLVALRLKESGLVEIRGPAEMVALGPQLFTTILDNLPAFFNSKDLSGPVAELLSPDKIRVQLETEFKRLFEVDGLGQTQALARDPLGLRYLALRGLAAMNPYGEATIYKGHFITKDYRHLLIIAAPTSRAQETSFGRRLAEVLEGAKQALAALPLPAGNDLRMSYAGAFRAALDNENIIRRDTTRAMTLVTIGELLLMILAFRRPWLGFLSLIPAVAGSMLATLAYSFFRDTIFAISLGFGGALISITVDHALTYVCLLDRPYETRGWRVSAEVWAVASFTVYTTLIALLSLSIIGIPLFAEVGLLAALGVALAAIMVHIIFPLLFPRLPASPRQAILPLERFMNRLTSAAGHKSLFLAGLLAVILAFFINLDFNADLSAMNTISPEAKSAEEMIGRTWGNFGGRTYIMAEGRTLDQLWSEAEKLIFFLNEEKDHDRLADISAPFAFPPGPRTRRTNLTAWREFWSPDRQAAVAFSLQEIGAELGFSPEAFKPFLETLANPQVADLTLPADLLMPLSVFPDRSGQGFLAVASVGPGTAYQDRDFFRRASQAGFSVFDPGFFSRHLAQELSKSFGQLLLVLLLCSLVLMIIRFADDWVMLLVTEAPLVFALVATLGTMGLLGLPLSIPSLMLAPVIVGMGVDYGLYLVCSRQRLGVRAHPGANVVPVAIILAGFSTLIGMGSLALSEHAVLRSAGLSTFLGIAYSIIGAFAILPPLLKRLFDRPRAFLSVPTSAIGSKLHRVAALSRFRHLTPYPRLFARFKMRLDPMFPRLGDFVRPGWTLIDLGCGYGVPAAWLLAVYPDLKFFSFEPNRRRAEVATWVLGEKALVEQKEAQELLSSPLDQVDAALIMDVIHYWPDQDLARILTRLRVLLKPGGRLIIRATIPADSKKTFHRRIETIKMRFYRRTAFFRPRAEVSRAIEAAGFRLLIVEPSATGREETWFIAET